MADFLLEIGTEEIPARMIDAAQAELARRIGELVVRERLAESPRVTPLSTPRRLAVLVEGVNHAQADREEQILGPAAAIAGKNPKAVEAFARKAGVAVSDLKTVPTPKGDYLAAHVSRKGRIANDILAELIPAEISSLYWPKSMYWRKKGQRFIRPVRWLVALLDGEIVPVEFGGIMAGAESRGHRQLAAGPVFVERAARYVEVLASARVLMQAEREHNIRKALDAAARTIPGARWREDKDLLNTVVNLTEFPSVISGSIDREFLSLPDEILVTVMRDHQKYFALEDVQGKLAPHFLAVLNTDSDPEGLIRHGNERVLRARFRDARFFWDADQKIPLRQRVEMLKTVTFQKDLGNYFEKAHRMVRLSDELAQQLAGSAPLESPATTGDQTGINCAAVREAALLAKTDLTSELVKEFTELQGIVGGLYAKAQGLPNAVADAIYDQYKPESMEAGVPRSIEAAVVSIGDKADSIAGMFALGLQPTGSKDPFALRRQANGIVKSIAEHELPFKLKSLFQLARAGYEGSSAAQFFVPEVEFVQSIERFLRERLEFYLRDFLGFSYDVVNAVLSADAGDVVDAVARAVAVSQVRASEDFAAIAAAFKRMKKILRQAREAGKWAESSDHFPRDVAGQQKSEVVVAVGEPAEKELALQTASTALVVGELRTSRHYEEALIEISKLRPVVDSFFDKVMVMVEAADARERRLGLLQRLVNEFSTIADFSEMAN